MRAFLILALVMMAGCSTAGGRAISSGERYVTSGDNESGYKLGVGDKVRVNVYNENSLSGEFQVNSAGALALPLIGDVMVQGRDVENVTTTVHDKLADGYLRDPKVNIEVLTYRPYFVLGEVKTPGQYPYLVGITALNAIAAAEGFTPRADKHAVFIRRAGSEQEQLYLLTPNLRVWPGDTLRLGERLF